MTTDMTHTPAEHVAQRIRMYRTRQHMTIDTLARKLHVSPSTISKYENARLALNVSVLFEIADALNVSVNQLTDYQKPGKPKIEKLMNAVSSDVPIFSICISILQSTGKSTLV